MDSEQHANNLVDGAKFDLARWDFFITENPMLAEKRKQTNWKYNCTNKLLN